ncbi:hypothetical protein CLV78_102129 [Aliiruegeria haliotis]|uniref:Type I restriction enzyme S subunit n=1 Tax=Aliiruegeria haliotis TaxID=1280846 RepID=A0A2T0RUS6_9RHOB|nr:hypothetical protein [Aliiruegeria haliotis]PRY24956.1 hypothetical protein CLV78_102129 [Aliiruegeria haliotis]
MTDHLRFSIKRSELRSRILIPKYYDPELGENAELAQSEFTLKPLGELLEEGPQGSRLGHWVRRDNYGTGSIPYVRTSDLEAWRIRPDFKKGLSEEVYEQFRDKQDVRPYDLLFVAHGTYLVGNVGIVLPGEERLVLQDHVFRLRLSNSAEISPHYLLAALSTSFCRRQVRAKQFSADIIDKIGNRHLEVLIPIHKERTIREDVSRSVEELLSEQNSISQNVSRIIGADFRMLRERPETNLGFRIKPSGIKSRILIPKYYDPSLVADIEAKAAEHDANWIEISELVASGLLSVTTGVEVGKLAYGTGEIPFLRTSDIAGLEVRHDPKHCVSHAIFEQYEDKASLEPNDILLVRDGTYLVGSSALVGNETGPSLCCGGMYRLRSNNKDELDPIVLLALLNQPLSRRQMRAKQFTRDVIDTLGKRLLEVLIPSPFSPNSLEMGARLSAEMRRKARVRLRLQDATGQIEPDIPDRSIGRPGWSMRA